MKEKRTINGVKDTKQNYTGNVVGTIKKIIALALTLGIVITAAQAIRFFNHWRDAKGKDVVAEDVQKLKEVTFEDVKEIVKDYREAQENNDTERLKALDEKLQKGNYFEVLNSELKEQIVESLGLDTEKVEVVIARDGVFLVDKEKASQRMIMDHTGQINPAVKYYDANGKNPPIPNEMKTMADNLGKDISFARFRGMKDLEEHYANFEYIKGYVLEIEDFER